MGAHSNNRIVYQLELKSKLRLMCEGGFIYIKPIAMSLSPIAFKVCVYMRVMVFIYRYKSMS